MVAALDEGELDIAAAQEIDKVERVTPGHVRIAHALQDAHRQIEMKRVDADEMVAPLLDQMLGDGIGIAIERRLVVDAVAVERRTRTVTTADGIYDYRVDRTLIVNPEDVYVLDPTDRPTLTLVTCYPFTFIGHAPQRFIIVGPAYKIAQIVTFVGE